MRFEHTSCLQTFACSMCVNSANYKAVQSLSLSTLNYERTSILLQYFMEHGEGACIAFPFPGFMKSILL